MSNELFQFNQSYFLILLITILSIVISNILYTYIPKITTIWVKNTQNSVLLKLSKHKTHLKFLLWQLSGIFFFVYLIYFRFWNDWRIFFDYIKNTNLTNNINDQYEHSLKISRALLLDMCPFMSLLLSLFSIFDTKGKLNSYIAPFCIFGGAISINFIPFSEPDQVINAHYFFVGSQLNPLYFFMHWYLTVFGILALRRNKSPQLKELIWLHLVAFLFYSYVNLMAYQFNVTYFISGVREYDWIGIGEYSGVSSLVNNKISFPWIMIISFSVVYILIVSSWILRVYLLRFLNKKHTKMSI